MPGPSDNAALVVGAVKDLEEKENAAGKNKRDAEKPQGKVNVGGKMLISTEANLDHHETMRLQSKVGVGKCSNMRVLHNLEGVTETLTEDKLTNEQALMVSGCKRCEINVEGTCVKVFVEKCEDLILRLRGKIITQTIEIDHSSQLNVLVYSKIGTLQVEQCQKINCLVASRDLLAGYMIWAGFFLLRWQVGDGLMHCDF